MSSISEVTIRNGSTEVTDVRPTGKESLAETVQATTAVADSKKSAPETKLLIMWIAFLAFLYGLVALAAYSLAPYPELWNAITGPTA